MRRLASCKNKLTIFLLSIAMLISLCRVKAEASDLWTEDYYRVTDGTGDLSELKRNDLDQVCMDFMKAHKCDLVLVAVDSDAYKDSSMADLARSYYDSYGFGSGEDRDCIILICDMEKEEGKYYFFGGAEGLISDSYLEFAEGSLFNYKEEHGVYGVLYSGARMLDNYFEDAGQEEEASSKKEIGSTADALEEDDIREAAEETSEEVSKEDPEKESADVKSSAASASANSLPDWYPEDVSSFKFFHDYEAPRVVDDAHILSDQDSEKLEQRLGEIRQELDRDIVIFTDDSAHGFSHEIYAADFYDFNGYGCGDDYEGACLMICMDPEDRGWYVSVAGPATEKLYTEEYANEMDDVLYPYMVRGDYAEGIAEWIELFYSLYTKGDPLAPSWIPSLGEEYERHNDPDAPRIDDTAGLLTEEEVRKLTEEAKEVSKKNDIDIVIHTAKSSGGMSSDEYAEKYYYYNGYGFGPDYDGILLNVIKGDHGYGEIVIYPYGSGNDGLNDVNKKRLEGFCKDAMRLESDTDYYKGMSRFISQVDHMRDTGRVPRSVLYWAWIAVFSAICGLIVGKVSLSGAKKRMEIPALKTNADHYLVKESLQVSGKDRYLGMSTHRRYDPVRTSDSGSRSSSGSSRSSYSSHYSGSSGRSHSGSGRRF